MSRHPYPEKHTPPTRRDGRSVAITIPHGLVDEADPDERQELCQPYPADDLDAYEISTRVNSPGNDEATVIEPLGYDQSGLGDFSSG